MVARPIPDLPDPGRFVYRCTTGILALTFVLLLAGAEVTSTNSGMAYRTWPDADGALLWPHNPTLSGVLEHTHRLLGWAVGWAAVVLVVSVHRWDRRPLMRKLAIGLLLAVIVQGALGGFRVLLDERFPILYPILHGTFAHLVFSFMGFVAFAASLAWVPRSIEDPGEVRTSRRLAVFAWLTVFLQIVLGAVTRHSNDPVAKWAHVSFAFVAALAVLVAAAHSMGKFGKIPGFKRMNRTLLGVLVAQILLGFVTLVVRRPKELSDTNLMGRATIVSLHVVLGAATLLLVSVLVGRSYRNLRPRPAP